MLHICRQLLDLMYGGPLYVCQSVVTTQGLIVVGLCRLIVYNQLTILICHATDYAAAAAAAMYILRCGWSAVMETRAASEQSPQVKGPGHVVQLSACGDSNARHEETKLL